MHSEIKTDEQDIAMQGGRGVLVNTNQQQYELYLARRKAMEAKTGEIVMLHDEINTLKEQMSNMTALLEKLLAQGK